MDQPFLHEGTREFPGKVRATRRVELGFSVPGLLEEVHAQEGRRFQAGAILARLDPRDYQSELDLAQARHLEAKSAFERTRSLRASHPGAISTSDCAKAAAAFQVTEANLRLRTKALQDSVLRAPFDGVVAKRYVENHEHIQAKQPILSFQDIAVIEIVIQMPEGLVAHGALNGMPTLEVHFDGDCVGWREVAIREFRLQADPACGTYDVVLMLPRPANLDVFPGMTTTVRHRRGLSAGKVSPAVLVPLEAVLGDGHSQAYVWTVEPAGGRPKRCRVETGALHEQGIEILSGLHPGEHVVVAGVHALREDLVVRPQPAGTEGLDL